jgi:hypothetical protein
MAKDDGPSLTSAVAQRLGKTLQYTSVYRARLIAAGLIAPINHGSVDFAMPYLRDYLRERGGPTA